MRRKFLLVFNPIAGPAGRTLLGRVVAALQQRGAEVTPYVPGATRVPTPSDVLAGRYDAVIAAGGDGTVRELAIALSGSNIPIGFIPMGTGNVLAHEIGLPATAEGLAAVLTDGMAASLQGARANGQPFYLMAGAGFDGEVVRRLDTPWKRRVGQLAYTAPVLRTLALPLPRLDVTVDGRAMSANWAVIANARCYGGAFVLAPGETMGSGELTAILVRAGSRAALVRKLMMLPLGRLTRQKGVDAIRCHRATIQATPAVATQVDGDPFGMTPLTVEAGGAPLTLIVPPRAGA